MSTAKGLDDLFRSGKTPRLRRMYPPLDDLRERRIPFQVKATLPAPGESLEGVRIRTSEAIHGFVEGAPASAGTALLVRTPPGIGKSQAVVSALRAHPRAARVMVGTLALAREQAPALNAHVVEGFSRVNCERFDIVQVLQEKGHPVAPNACGTAAGPRCPFFSRCRYQAQFRQQGTLIGAAEQMFNPRWWEGAELAVFDDADLLRTAVQRSGVSSAHMHAAALAHRGRSANC